MTTEEAEELSDKILANDAGDYTLDEYAMAGYIRKLLKHVRRLEHVDEQEIECKRCGMCYCDCKEGKKI